MRLLGPLQFKREAASLQITNYPESMMGESSGSQRPFAILSYFMIIAWKIKQFKFYVFEAYLQQVISVRNHDTDNSFYVNVAYFPQIVN